MRRLAVALVALQILAATAFGQPLPEATKVYGPETSDERLLVRSTTDIALFEPILLAFADAIGEIRIEYEQWGSNDLFRVSELECRASAGAADIVISSSIDQQVKLANDGCAIQHQSPETTNLPTVSNWRDEVFGITREPAVIVYNKTFFDAAEAPKSRFDLIDLLRSEDNRLNARVATYDIEASGLGYLFAFADSRQATTFGSLMEALGRSEAVADCCSTTLIDGVVSGEYLIAYNVLGSYALARAEENDDIVVVAPDDYTLVLSRAALIPKGAARPDLAGELIDFLLSEQGRSELRKANFIVDTGGSAHPALRLPENPEISLRPIPLTPALLVGLDTHKRRQFIERWRATFSDRERKALE